MYFKYLFSSITFSLIISLLFFQRTNAYVLPPFIKFETFSSIFLVLSYSLSIPAQFQDVLFHLNNSKYTQYLLNNSTINSMQIDIFLYIYDLSCESSIFLISSVNGGGIAFLAYYMAYFWDIAPTTSCIYAIRIHCMSHFHIFVCMVEMVDIRFGYIYMIFFSRFFKVFCFEMLIHCIGP